MESRSGFVTELQWFAVAAVGICKVLVLNDLTDCSDCKVFAVGSLQLQSATRLATPASRNPLTGY
jgi:hypothetical protein